MFRSYIFPTNVFNHLFCLTPLPSPTSAHRQRARKRWSRFQNRSPSLPPPGNPLRSESPPQREREAQKGKTLYVTFIIAIITFNLMKCHEAILPPTTPTVTHTPPIVFEVVLPGIVSVLGRERASPQRLESTAPGKVSQRSCTKGRGQKGTQPLPHFRNFSFFFLLFFWITFLVDCGEDHLQGGYFNHVFFSQ